MRLPPSKGRPRLSLAEKTTMRELVNAQLGAEPVRADRPGRQRRARLVRILAKLDFYVARQPKLLT